MSSLLRRCRIKSMCRFAYGKVQFASQVQLPLRGVQHKCSEMKTEFPVKLQLRCK